jgi:hypothetical protein
MNGLVLRHLLLLERIRDHIREVAALVVPCALTETVSGFRAGEITAPN